MHSALTDRQRQDAYQRMQNGTAKIAIGTRSAVFAPVQNLGILIVDEEGERTYKSENAPRYHAVAVARGIMRSLWRKNAARPITVRCCWHLQHHPLKATTMPKRAFIRCWN